VSAFAIFFFAASPGAEKANAASKQNNVMFRICVSPIFL
jgi:hypothetical protein